MQGTMPGACRRGRPRTAWVDNIKTWTGLLVEESVRMTEDRDKWRKYVHGVRPTLGSRTAKEQNRTVYEFFYWHCPHSPRSSVYGTVQCPSVCLFHSPATASRGGFAAVGPAGKIYRHTAAAAGRRSSTAHSSVAFCSKCEQCHVVS